MIFIFAIENIRRKYHDSKISTKIILVYALCYAALLLAINIAVWYGISVALYMPASRTIEFSMKNVQSFIEDLENGEPGALEKDTIRDPLVPGVVVRVIKDDGTIIADTDSRYPSNERFEQSIMKSPPFFANPDMEISQIGNALVYRARMDYVYKGEHVTLYFFRTITARMNNFRSLELTLFAIDFVGILLAVFLGKFISRTVLRPITQMTKLAKEIAFGKMEKRVPIPPANDELAELAKTFNEMLDRLQGGISKQQKFVSDASHELRTPATVIAGYIEMLEKYGRDDKALMAEGVEAIRSEAQNMQNLLENLLFLARTDRNRQKLHKEVFDLSEIVGDSLQKMMTVTDTHEVSLPRNDSAQIYGDKTTIRQMLRIFLDNATKYTPPGGKIIVNSILDGDKIRLSVSDTGIGIAPENREKIFERFFRIDSETLVDDVNGSGLGLSIAKWIADNHGITIDVDGAPGKGTTFTLNIPVVAK